MARLTMTSEHKLGREEALRRLKEKLGGIPEYRGQIGDPCEEWDGDTLSFRFKVVGVKVSGKVTVSDAAVRVAAELPFAAIVFKKQIDRRVRAELDALLH